MREGTCLCVGEDERNAFFRPEDDPGSAGEDSLAEVLDLDEVDPGVVEVANRKS